VDESRSASQKLADHLLGDGGLDALVAERRAAGDSWRQVALALHLATNGAVSLTDETLRRWYGERASA
jgi:hypothetical protein